jgi:hypothetical protein
LVLTAKTLMIVDSILLLSSIIVSESLAFTAYIINSILSCCTNGNHWHQYIRKVCHLIRWAFRDIYITTSSENNKIQRNFPFCQQRRRRHRNTTTKTKNNTSTSIRTKK